MPTSFEAQKAAEHLSHSKSLFIAAMNGYLFSAKKHMGRQPFEELKLYEGMQVAEIKVDTGPAKWWEPLITLAYLPVVKVIGLKGTGVKSMALLDTNANLFPLFIPEESAAKNDVVVSLNSYPYRNKGKVPLITGLTEGHGFLKTSSPLQHDLIRVSFSILKPTAFASQSKVDSITTSLNDGRLVNRTPFNFRRN